MLLPSAVVDGLKYNESHEWAKVDGGTATVGLSDFAQVIITMHGVTCAWCWNVLGSALNSRCVLFHRRSWGTLYTWSCQRLAPRSSIRNSLAWSNPSRQASPLLPLSATLACAALDRRTGVKTVVHAVTNMSVHHMERCPCFCLHVPSEVQTLMLLFLQAASDVYSPVSGEVTEVNSALTDDPSTVRLGLLLMSQLIAAHLQLPLCVAFCPCIALHARSAVLNPYAACNIQVNSSPFDDGWLMKVGAVIVAGRASQPSRHRSRMQGSSGRWHTSASTAVPSGTTGQGVRHLGAGLAAGRQGV